jgi:5'-nucleotidase
VPSIAISLGTHSREADFSFAARFARKVAHFMLHLNLNRHIPLNVNVPAIPEKEIKGVVVTRQGQARLREEYERRTDPRENVYYWLAGETQVEETEDAGTDFVALRSGMISITPIYYDMTRYDVMEELREKIGELTLDKVKGKRTKDKG